MISQGFILIHYTQLADGLLGSNVVACKEEASPINEKELAIFARNAISPDYCPNYSVYISEEDIYAFFRFDGISTIYYSGKKRGDY